MTRNANCKRTRATRLIGFALTTALAGATLASCAASAPPAAISASKAENALAKGKYAQAIEHAEAAVMADPRNGAYRAVLGAAYLEAGRFASAATSFQDAIDLGDSSPRNALSLALALTAEGKHAAAQEVLREWEGSIGAGDLGLAWSLAGNPARGVQILTNALRNGENTPKIRQNLAYSHALAGQWRESRLMASEDIPADKVGDRMAQWAAEIHPELYRTRVASLLSVPANAADPGQPVQLALANFPTADQLALEAARAAPAPQPAPAQVVAQASAPPAPRSSSAALPAPPAAPASVRSSAVPQPATRVALGASHENAGATGLPSASASAGPVATASSRAISDATAQPLPSRSSAPAIVSSASASSAPARTLAPVASGVSSDGSSHLVQLGSFSTEKGARRAWDIYVSRYPELASRDMVITRAIVRGKEYFRVAAAGYDAGSSRAMCGRVNRSPASEGCIAYAASKPLPGAVDSGRRFAMR